MTVIKLTVMNGCDFCDVARTLVVKIEGRRTIGNYVCRDCLRIALKSFSRAKRPSEQP